MAAKDIERLREWKTVPPDSSGHRGIVFALKSSRKVKYGAALLSGILLVAFALVPILRGFASLLIVEDLLRPAAAIVALGEQAPFREIEAAKLYTPDWRRKLL